MREGDRSEYYALPLMSALGLTVPIPRQEDVGFDFHCNLADQETGVLTFGSPFLLSVKSISNPNIELEPTEAQKRDNNQRHIEWLFRSEIPAFLGVVDKDSFTIRLYSLMPVWFLFYKGGMECGSLHIKPRLDPAWGDDIGPPVRGEEIPGWSGMYHYDCDLGHPTVVVSLQTLAEREQIRVVKHWLRVATGLYLQNIIHLHLQVPYFNWIVKTRPEGGNFVPAFYHVGIPNVDKARVEAIQSMRHPLISLALHFKEANRPDKLEAIRLLLDDLPENSFEQEIRDRLPEIITKR
jgi:hypothetical protein